MIRNIQALRGIAALLVLWHHLRFALNGLLPAYRLPPILMTSLGAIGVDVFFVISGFVISLTAVQKHHHSLEFFTARVVRVVPLYLTTSAFLILVKVFVAKESFSFCAIWNAFFYLPVWDTHYFSMPPNLLGWTLSFEMWFYILFALFLNFMPALQVVARMPLFLGVGAALMTLYQGTWFFPSFAFSPFVLEFAFGCLLFRVVERLKGSVAWLLLLGGIAYFLVFSRHTSELGWFTVERNPIILQRIALWGVPAALIVSGLVGLELGERVILPPILVWFGKISFSFYIIQRIVISAVVAVGAHLHGITPLEVIALTVGTNVILGYGCWRFIEKPLTAGARKAFLPTAKQLSSR